MIITSQGFGHFTDGLNNQDFGIETSRMLLILDGCSGAKYSEVGTKLFAQMLSRKEECDNVEKFEENVKNVFDDLIEMMEKYYSSQVDLEEKFIMENLLFTIIACFETEDKYIVKIFGDGYIVTVNNRNCISYMKFSYGKCPPYFAYKYCNLNGIDFKKHEFKTFSFDKKTFSKVIIATDGIMPIAKGIVKDVDSSIIAGKEASIEMNIRSQRQSFYDDITIGMFGGKNNEEKNNEII